MNIYIVGPLFSEAESKQRIYEEECLKSFLDSKKIDHIIFNPISMPLNSAQQVTASQIALADYKRLSLSDVCFIDLANEDSGSCVALGILIEKMKQGKDIKFYPVISDIRMARESMSGYESSYGFNSMVIGILKSADIKIYGSFDEALNSFMKDFD